MVGNLKISFQNTPCQPVSPMAGLSVRSIIGQGRVQPDVRVVHSSHAYSDFLRAAARSVVRDGRGGGRSLSSTSKRGPVGLEKALLTGGRKAEALEVKHALVVTKTTRYQDEAMRISGKSSWQEVRIPCGHSCISFHLSFVHVL